MKSKNTIHITQIIIIDIAPVYFHKVYLGMRECDNCNFIFAKYFTFIMLSLYRGVCRKFPNKAQISSINLFAVA